jgi:CRP/FNR family transcriptional regulator, cyclic AMP receptor protein
MMKNPSAPHMDEVVPTDEDSCKKGECREILCGRMRNELKFLTFLADEDLNAVAHYFRCRRVPAGEIVWSDGDPGDYIAFVISGRIQVNKKTDLGGKSIVLGIFSRGAILGEISFLQGDSRYETASAVDTSDLILLTRENFQQLLSERPSLGIKFLEGILLTVSRRLRKSYERLAAIF